MNFIFSCDQSKTKIAFENTKNGPPEADKLRAENFYDCIRPAYILSRIFGLLPFSINYNGNGHVESVCAPRFDAIWFVGAILMNLLFTYFTIDTIKGSKQAQLTIFGGKLVLIFCL